MPKNKADPDVDFDVNDPEACRRFLATSPEAQAWMASPEGRRALRPTLLKFLGSVGITPEVDTETGEIMVNAPALIAALGLNEAEALEEIQKAGMGAVKVVPSERLKPLQ
jgi:hypothetical protein